MNSYKVTVRINELDELVPIYGILKKKFKCVDKFCANYDEKGFCVTTIELSNRYAIALFQSRMSFPTDVTFLCWD